MSVYFKIVIVLYLLEVVLLATLQRCPDAIACHLKCNDTNCQQYCKFPPCSMTCDGAIICYQFCYRGNCPMMECLNTQYCQSNCTGGNCLGMSCQATDTCRLTCGQAFCFMTCSAPNCFADCQGGGCDITFVGNSQGTVSCPGGNCRIRCPGPDNCVIKDCGQMNSCTVSYEITPKHLG